MRLQAVRIMKLLLTTIGRFIKEPSLNEEDSCPEEHSTSLSFREGGVEDSAHECALQDESVDDKSASQFSRGEESDYQTADQSSDGGGSVEISSSLSNGSVDTNTPPCCHDCHVVDLLILMRANLWRR